MSVFRFDKVVGRARGVRTLPLLLREKLISNKLMSKRQKLRRIRNELRRTADRQTILDYKKRKKSIQQEIFRLENDLRSAEEARSNGDPNGGQALQAASDPVTGAIPDFLIIGARKCGTTFLYDLISRHPYVQPAVKKELHYFDIFFNEEGIDWYRRCFPVPRWKDGCRTITGEATPYLDASRVPERIAKVLPQARLIALLRDPVQRAYSDYQQVRRKGREPLPFEEAIEAEKRQPKGLRGYLSRGIYVDHLLCWSRFFAEDQLLVLKSEDFFGHTQETLERVLDFLDLPKWDADVSETRNNKGEYETQMAPATRQRLEEYFEPHNGRLYEYLGVNFEW